MESRGNIEYLNEKEKPMLEVPILYSPAEAAKLMGISRSQVYILLNKGLLRSVHIGRSRRITRGHIDEFICELDAVA